MGIAQAAAVHTAYAGNRIGQSLDQIRRLAIVADRDLVFGLALVLMMVLRPGGLFPSKQRAAEMQPDDEDIAIQEQQDLYDVRTHSDPTPDEQGGQVQ